MEMYVMRKNSEELVADISSPVSWFLPVGSVSYFHPM